MTTGLTIRLRLAAPCAALLAIAVGFLVLIGWMFDLDPLTTVLPGLVAMNPTTALTFVAVGASLWLLGGESVGRHRRRAGQALALLVITVAIAKLEGVVTGRDLGADQLVFREKLAPLGSALPNRMAPNTALGFLLLGLALVALSRRSVRAVMIAQLLASLTTLVGLLTLVGYTYGESALTGLPSAIHMALNTAVTLSVLSIGILCARPDQGVMTVICSDRAGGVMSRRLLPAAIVLPPVLGWLRLTGERTGLYDTTFGLSLLVIALVVLFALLVLLSAKSLDRLDAERRRLEEERRALLAREHAAQAAEERAHLAAIVESSEDAIIGKTLDGIITSWNAAAETLYGYAAEEALGEHVSMLWPADRAYEVPQILAQLRQGKRVDRFETVRQRKDGETIDLSLTVSPIKDRNGQVLGGAVLAHDISERKRAQITLEHQALYDALTDLPNRTLFQDRLGSAIRAAHREDGPLTLLLTDLDRFKEVNDTFGHHVGDLLLQEAAIRIQQGLREVDTAARLGGDEFAVVLPGTDEQGAVVVATRILTALSRPIVLEDKTFDIRTSIGIACYGPHGVDAATLLRAADVAMYTAKRRGDEYAVYTADKDDNSASRLTLITDLRHAIEHDQLVLHYQPKVDLKTGEVTSVEALVRWQHPERGFIPPDRFIPLAEHTGLIKPLTKWVLNEALRQCRDWHRAGLPIDVAVNLSAWSLYDPDLVETVRLLLDRWTVEPSSLGLELTESVVMTDPVRAKGTLTQLHALGVQVSIDDFGTGYSSLGYLKRLPVQQLKIDKSFVMQMASTDDDAFIARTIVDLSHNLGLEVVAEGVEDRQTLRLLAMMGCDLAQGYHLSRPLAASDLQQFLAPNQSCLVAEINHALKEAAEERQTQPLPDAGQTRVVGKRLVQVVPDIPAMRQIEAGDIDQLTFRS
jgi:diguanylate cyclase (GGDEF)-like protein/PAS domain S-box-containing protein